MRHPGGWTAVSESIMRPQKAPTSGRSMPRTPPPTGAAAVPRRARYVLNDQVGFLMRVAMQRHTAIFASRMIEGLTPTQFAALAKLFEVGACSQNRLGRLICLDAATIKGVVDRLRARGFVAADRDPEDRRRRAVTLTQAGRRAAVRAVAVGAEITATTLEPLGANERRAVVRLLRKLG